MLSRIFISVYVLGSTRTTIDTNVKFLYFCYVILILLYVILTLTSYRQKWCSGTICYLCNYFVLILYNNVYAGMPKQINVFLVKKMALPLE